MNGMDYGFGKIGALELSAYFAIDYRVDCDYYFVCGIT